VKRSFHQIIGLAREVSCSRFAQSSGRFFKSGKGEYGEGMQFLGIRAADQTKVAAECLGITPATREKLLQSKWHELKLICLRSMVLLYQNELKNDPRAAAQIYHEYVSYFSYIDNWDLVDVSCHKIIGPHLANRSRRVLYRWAKSKNMWVRRISMVSCWYFIRQGDLEDCFALAEMHLGDSHDLMHKAVGWMLREAGKKDRKQLNLFLDQFARTMPRTTLRYALERHAPAIRKKYMLAYE